VKLDLIVTNGELRHRYLIDIVYEVCLYEVMSFVFYSLIAFNTSNLSIKFACVISEY